LGEINMSSELYNFLEAMNSDPVQLNAYIQNQEETLNGWDLSDEIKEALKNGELQKILQLLGPPPAPLARWITVPILYTFVSGARPHKPWPGSESSPEEAS
jgi:hypothetical protein